MMQQGLAQMVKLEGTKPEVIAFLVAQGIPVCGHLGLLPQSINQLGGYRVQGKEKSAADKMRADALKLEQVGASLLVLECVPAILAKNIASQLRIPVIGIGASVDCDGQVLVLYDMLDIGVSHRPKFSKNYLQNASNVAEAVSNYIEDVKQLRFHLQSIPINDSIYLQLKYPGMQIVNSIKQLRQVVRSWQQAGETVGFVATMGNLHQGHFVFSTGGPKNVLTEWLSVFL